MPTREQVEAVTGHIEILIGGLDIVRLEGDRVIPASEGRGEGYFWEDLTESQRRGALSVAIGWEGFTESQKAEVINRVVEGEEPEFWMDGVEINSVAEAEMSHRAADLRDENRREVMDDAFYSKLGSDFQDALVGDMDDPDNPLRVPDDVKAELAQRERDYLVRRDAIFESEGLPEVEEVPSPGRIETLAAEIREDEHAARFRDYGEADAATYEQRLAEGASTIRHVEPEPPPVSSSELDQVVSRFERQWIAPRDEFKAILRGETPSTLVTSPEQDKGHER